MPKLNASLYDGDCGPGTVSTGGAFTFSLNTAWPFRPTGSDAVT